MGSALFVRGILHRLQFLDLVTEIRCTLEFQVFRCLLHFLPQLINQVGPLLGCKVADDLFGNFGHLAAFPAGIAPSLRSLLDGMWTGFELVRNHRAVC